MNISSTTVLFSVGSHQVTLWQVGVLAVMVLVMVFLVRSATRSKPPKLSAEAELVYQVFRDAWEKVGGTENFTRENIEHFCREHYSLVEGELYYQWHDTRGKLRTTPALDTQKLVYLSLVAEVLSRGKE